MLIWPLSRVSLGSSCSSTWLRKHFWELAEWNFYRLIVNRKHWREHASLAPLFFYLSPDSCRKGHICFFSTGSSTSVLKRCYPTKMDYILASVNAKRWRRCKYVTYTVDDTGWLLELEDVDKSTSGEVIAWRVWRRTAAAVAAGTRRRLWDASLPPSWAARVGDEGFQLEPARLRSWAVHVNVEQPVVVTVSVSVINIFTCYSLWYRGRI